MPRSPTGTFTLVNGNPVVTGTIITSDWANDTMPDIGAALTDSLSRSGAGGMLAPVRGVAGTVTSPAHSYSDFPRTGMYAFSETDTRITVDGVDRMRWREGNTTTQTWDSDLKVWVDINTVATVVGANKLINGCFDIWQRATNVQDDTSGLEYVAADRWRFRRNGNATGMRIARYASQQPAGVRYGALVDRVTNDANTDNMLAGYQMATEDAYPLQGQAVTLTLGVRVGSQFSAPNVTLAIASGTGEDEIISLSSLVFPTGNVALVSDSTLFDVGNSSETQVASVTFTVPVDATELAFRLTWAPEGVYNTSGQDGIIIFYAKLETGVSATPFVTQGSSLGAEMALCQRYGQTRSTNTVDEDDLRPSMRDTPAITGAGPYFYDAEIPV